MATKKSKTGRKIILFGVILIALGGVAAWALLAKREPVISVQTEKVGRRTLTERVSGNGRI